MIRFGYTILYVQDVEKTLTFYETAFGCIRKFITPDGTYGELLTGETTLSFASIAFAGSNLQEGFIESTRTAKPFGIEIGFVSDEVETTLQNAIDAGGIVVAELKAKPWGQQVAYIRDPDGFLVEICSPMA
jgi:uncharacterized glyoxalase superfamily protein PhnB